MQTTTNRFQAGPSTRKSRSALRLREAADETCCRDNPCRCNAAPQRSERAAELQGRAARVAELPLDYMPSAEFSQPGVAARILAPLPAGPETRRKERVPAGLPSYLASLYEVPLLTAEQERHLFRKYNYLKFRARTLREGLVSGRPNARSLDEIERLFAEAVETKNQIIRANLRLVVSIAKNYPPAQDGLFETVSDGNVSLIKAVEKFDYTRGFKFSTYATWAIKNNFARDYANRRRQADRFRNGQEERLDVTADSRSDGPEQLRRAERHKLQVAKILGCLDDREREIVMQRYGLEGRPEGQTLKDIGAGFGISKERIRQIETRSLDKLRETAVREKIDAL